MRLVNQPAFVYHPDAVIEVPGIEALTVDVAFGGMTDVIVDAEQVALNLDITEEAAVNDIGERVKKAAVEQLPVSQPENPRMRGITNTSFTGPLHHEKMPGRHPNGPVPQRRHRLARPARPLTLRLRDLGPAGAPARVRHRTRPTVPP